MRILLIDKNLVDPVNYQKWEILSSKSDVEFRAVFPSKWMENYKILSAPDDFRPSFPVRSLPVIWRGFENSLKSTVKDLGISHRVAFVPAVDPYQARLIIRALDVLVLPSLTTKRWKEQFGRVLAEAMSLGTPVIGSSSGAIPEIIGDAGLVFKEGDPVPLAEAIRKLERNEALRSDLSRMGLVRSEEFSPKKFAEKLYIMLNDLNH